MRYHSFLRVVGLCMALGWASVPASAASAAQAARGRVIADFPRGDGPRAIGITEAGQDAQPAGPSGLIDAAHGGAFILDSVNKRIIRVDPAGKIEVAATIPNSGFAQDILRQDQSVYVLGNAPIYVGQDRGKGKITRGGMPESSSEGPGSVASAFEANGAVLSPGRVGTPENAPVPSDIGPWLPVAGPTPRAGEYRISRQKQQALVVEIRQENNSRQNLRLEIPASPALVGSIGLLGMDRKGHYYVRTEQLTRPDAGRVKVWILRYDQKGNLDGGYDVPDERMELVPNRYLALSDDGRVYFLESRLQKTRLWLLDLLPRAQFVKWQANTMRKLAGAAGAMRNNTEATPPTARSPESGNRSTPLPRSEILALAESFRTAEWTVGDKNYADSAPSRCAPAKGYLWMRPAYLDDQRGKTVTGVPYNWGGYMSVTDFLQRIKTDALGGNICTCRSTYNCVQRKAAGVDCSGFVSQVWKIPRHTTISLMKKARRLASLQELQPGDAINKPNSHVRLFVAFSPAGNGAIRAYEASTSCGRVCMRDFTTKQLEGYVPLAAPSI